jgi:hypothetical protein
VTIVVEFPVLWDKTLEFYLLHWAHDLLNIGN